MQKYQLNINKVYDSRLMDRTTIRHILEGKSVNTKYYDRLLEWLEKNHPKVYKEAVNRIIENLDKFKME